MYLNSWQKHQGQRATVGRYRDMPGQVKDLLVLGARRYSSPVLCAFSTARENIYPKNILGVDIRLGHTPCITVGELCLGMQMMKPAMRGWARREPAKLPNASKSGRGQTV